MRPRFRLLWPLLAACSLATMLGAQVLNPAMDKPGAPFSYASASTDEMSLMDAPMGTEITPSGSLYTGYGEMMFLVGYPAQPAYQRIRTLEDGYLPIFHYEYRDGAVTYRVTTLTGTVSAESNAPVNFIRVVATNSGHEARTSYFTVAIRYTGAVDTADGDGTHRFRRPVTPGHPGAYAQPGVEFNPQWVYGFDQDLALRSGKVVYEFPTASKPVLWLTRLQLFSKAQKLNVLPDTPVLLAQYAVHLQPGQSQTLDFKMPVQPLAAEDHAAVASLRQATFSDAEARVRSFWRGMLRKGIQISVPEAKVADTFKANLIDDMMARDHVGDDYIQTVNKLQYHAFWLRDGSNIAHAYEVAGYPELARQDLLFFLKTQRPDGLFLSQEGQYDGWGQAVWALGKYVQYTGDLNFARQVYPAVQKAVAWLKQARQQDSMHLMPASIPHDDEFTHTMAHTTGFNFWALDGLQQAIGMARALGNGADAADWQHEYDDYSATLQQAIKKVTARTGGYITPGLDVSGGQDWGNMMALYPEQVLPLNDPDIPATIRATRAKFAEGLMTYGGRLHHYITMKDTETEVMLGEQQLALDDLYAVLVHTSSTHAGFEWGVRPWADRDFGQDLAPHGWFSAEYIILLRNMLLREQGNELHLLSVLSPSWTRPGDHVDVTDAPTLFGPVSLHAAFRTGGMTLTLQQKFHAAPAEMVVHLPWYVRAGKATADGHEVAIHRGAITIPASTRRVEVEWIRMPAGGSYSYLAAVQAWKQQYAAHDKALLRNGSPRPTPIPLK